MRDGLCLLLAEFPEVAFVNSTAPGPEMLKSATVLRPDAVILDFPPTALAGARIIAALKNGPPSTRVIVLTSRDDTPFIEAALHAGADGYLLKTDSRDELREALVSVLEGTRYLSASISSPATRARKIDAGDAVGRATEPIELTERERQVIRLITAGHRTREIAQALSLSHKTIEKHRSSLMRKLGLRNASAVAAYAISHGFAED